MKDFFFKLFGGPMVHGHRTVSPVKLGVALVLIVVIGSWAMFNKTKVSTWLTPGDTIQVHFAREYRLFAYNSKVKVSYVPVGIVTGTRELDDRTSLVDVKLNSGVKDKLGSAPMAIIRPTTLLGGNYFLDLVPGGDKGAYTQDTIPVERTRVPTELDAITRAMQPNALTGLQGFVRNLDGTLEGGGSAALQRFVSDAPGSLKPTSEVLQALQGTNPQRDLRDVVDGLENFSREFSQPAGRTDAIIRDFAATSAAFGHRSPEFSATLARLPSALRETDAGLKRLNVTLDVVQDTASAIRPTAKQLDPTLAKLEPVLDHAKPVVRDLHDAVQDLQPVVDDLRPVSKDLKDVMDDLNGDGMKRLNGPIRDMLHSPFQGTGPFKDTKTTDPIFKNVVWALANLDRAIAMDANGGGISFQPGVIPEPMENVVQNDGKPRFEGLLVGGTQGLNQKSQKDVLPPPPYKEHGPSLPLTGGNNPLLPGGGK